MKVLVVDNDKDMCRVISDVLKEEGISVSCAYRGKDALSKIKKEKKIDLMILDYKLFGISGLTVLERARRIRPAIKAIMISAYGDDSTREKAKELRVYAFLDKPFNIKRLVKVVKRALARRDD